MKLDGIEKNNDCPTVSIFVFAYFSEDESKRPINPNGEDIYITVL